MKNQASEICGKVKKIYDWLDSQLADVADKCGACGNCCDFENFGHKLFITSPELLYFKINVKDLKPMPIGVCPYMQDNKCTAREFRFAGCRIFFCKADKEFQNKLSERAIKYFKQICDNEQLPYRYVDLATALNDPEFLRLENL
jgi:hypothetical protein